MDVSQYFGKEWPFMKTVHSEVAGDIKVENRPSKIISSYSYLDLAHKREVIDYGYECAKAFGSGNHGPRMLCGSLSIYEKFEKLLAEFFKKEHALSFSSGYLACVSVITGLARKGDILLMDKLCHNSL